MMDLSHFCLFWLKLITSYLLETKNWFMKFLPMPTFTKLVISAKQSHMHGWCKQTKTPPTGSPPTTSFTPTQATYWKMIMALRPRRPHSTALAQVKCRLIPSNTTKWAFFSIRFSQICSVKENRDLCLAFRSFNITEIISMTIFNSALNRPV